MFCVLYMSCSWYCVLYMSCSWYCEYKCTHLWYMLCFRYHDMPDVVDFLVLKQNYDIAMDRKWKPGMFQYVLETRTRCRTHWYKPFTEVIDI